MNLNQSLWDRLADKHFDMTQDIHRHISSDMFFDTFKLMNPGMVSEPDNFELFIRREENKRSGTDISRSVTPSL